MGFLIESPTLAKAMHSGFEQDVPERAYQGFLDANGDLYWLGRQNGRTQRYDTEPDSAWTRRMLVRFLSLLPIDWLL